MITFFNILAKIGLTALLILLNYKLVQSLLFDIHTRAEHKKNKKEEITESDRSTDSSSNS